jgi:hypothetical protein
MDIFPPYFDGTMREHYLLLFGTASALALVVGSVGAWLGAWFGARRATRRALDNPEQNLAGLANARLEQLAESIDLIGLEVERIAEAQRFTARLLSDQQALPLKRREPGITTPH